MNTKSQRCWIDLHGGAGPVIGGTIWMSLLIAATGFGAEAPDFFPVSIRVDAAQRKGDLRPVWRFFGYDEANYTYMKDGKKLLAELGQLGATTVFIRAHNLLNSGNGSPALKWSSTDAYTENAEGTPIYNWTIVDRIFDTYLERGLKPFVEIGFMPEALSTHPQDYPHNPPPNQISPVGTGQSYPPKDDAKWGELCYQWARHCVEKYGSSEVEQWWWEVWNEPNIRYFRGTPAEYHQLYDFAVDGVRRALPKARVGGPHTAGGPGGQFLHNFLEHCLRGTNSATGKIGAPLDFIAFHAKGSPKFENGHVRMGISAQLQNIDAGFATVASFPELKKKPIVIGESDPEGGAARLAPELGYRTGTLYASYTAASFARKYELADKYGVNFEGALTWAFEFENQPYFAGYRVLASNGIDLPVLNVFRMFGLMGGQRLAVVSSADPGVESMRSQGVRGSPDVSALASLHNHKLCVLLWHYHDDDVTGPSAVVDLSLAGLPLAKGEARIWHHRIDREHSNAFERWKRMGSPQDPSPGQYAQLEKAGQLATLDDPTIAPVENHAAQVRLTLPRQAVSLLVFAWQSK
jgi:xylan 1,4-beta-xylosidase